MRSARLSVGDNTTTHGLVGVSTNWMVASSHAHGALIVAAGDHAAVGSCLSLGSRVGVKLLELRAVGQWLASSKLRVVLLAFIAVGRVHLRTWH